MRKLIITTGVTAAALLAAGPAQAAPLPGADLPTAGAGDLFKAHAAIVAEDGVIEIDGTKHQLGELTGALDMLAVPCTAPLAADKALGLDSSDCGEGADGALAWGQVDLHLSTPPAAEKAGDFGHVRVHLHQGEDGTFDIRVETETSPSGEAQTLVNHDPVTLTADEETFGMLSGGNHVESSAPLYDEGSTEEVDPYGDYSAKFKWGMQVFSTYSGRSHS
ncbi:hypothetical protein [Glycomyces rhizosphaerae]|uniref:Uncharacterized protein n=1 Tax=Glycomyces rhizosphaerae TaxID=2054422 RepID=A0ABV7PUV8_9ACTN